jgi:Trk K+ transport system NAD-binding subunit
VAGEYADWRGHVIVCGLRGVGFRIVEQLSVSGVPAVVIDDDPDVRLARILANWNVPHIAASSRTAEALAGAGLAGATAVVCAHQDDLDTLGAALLTRRFREDVRVVAQLGNPAVGRALAQVGVSVLDVAGLSSPSVVELCLRSDAREIVLSGERFIAAKTTAPRSASLRELYGALAPIAVVSAADGDVVICPGRDVQVAAGDEVTLAGTPDGLHAAGMGRYADAPASPVPSAVSRPARYARRLAMSLLDAADRRLALALGALLAVLAASTAVLRLAYHLAGMGHMSLLDAAYFTVETVSTVGYGDFSFRSGDSASPG